MEQSDKCVKRYHSGGYRGHKLTITIFPSLISLTNLVSLPSHFCVCTNVSPSTVKVDWKQRQVIEKELSMVTELTLNVGLQVCPSAYFDVSVIRRGLIKLLSQFGGDLRVSEGAQSFHHHFVSILANHYCRFSDISHLSCSKSNTCESCLDKPVN